MASSYEEMGRNKGWAGLTLDEKTAAAHLGFNDELWDAGETPEPCLQPWARLCQNSLHMNAAVLLGYTQEIWDAELGEGDDAIDEAAALASASVFDEFDDDDPIIPDDEDGAGGASQPNGGGAAASQQQPAEVHSEFNGVKLHLSDKSGTGYKGVCLRPGDRYTVTFGGRSHGAFSTPEEAAVKYAQLTSSVRRPSGGGGGSSSSSGGGSGGTARQAAANMAAAEAAKAAKAAAYKGAAAPAQALSSSNWVSGVAKGKAADGSKGKGGGGKVKGGSSAHPMVVHYVKGVGEMHLRTEIDGMLLHLSPSSHTGYKGVGKQNSGPGKQYQAHLGHGAGSSLGYFGTAIDAAIAYAKRVQELKGRKEADAAAIASRPAESAQQQQVAQAAAAEAKEAAEAAKSKKRKSGEGSSGGGGGGGGGTPPNLAGEKRSHKKKKPTSPEMSAAADAAAALDDDEGDDDEEGEGDELVTEEDVACAKCARTGDAFQMLLCDGDGCTVAQHTYCCNPPLVSAPAGDWFCGGCTLKRQPTQGMTGRQQMRYLQELAAKEEADAAAAADRAAIGEAAPPPPPAAAHAGHGGGRPRTAGAAKAAKQAAAASISKAASSSSSKEASGGSKGGGASGGGKGGGAAVPLVTDAHGIKLYLSDKSSTGCARARARALPFPLHPRAPILRAAAGHRRACGLPPHHDRLGSVCSLACVCVCRACFVTGRPQSDHGRLGEHVTQGAAVSRLPHRPRGQARLVHRTVRHRHRGCRRRRARRARPRPQPTQPRRRSLTRPQGRSSPNGPRGRQVTQGGQDQGAERRRRG